MIKKIFAAVMMIALMAFTQNAYAAPEINYQVHVQDIGWMHPVAEDQVAGTEGRGKRIEAIIIILPPLFEEKKLRAHNSSTQLDGYIFYLVPAYPMSTVFPSNAKP